MIAERYTLAQLADASWLESVKPLPHELEALRGCPQPPEHHPEGDALNHTILCVKAMDRFEGSFGLRGNKAPLWLRLAVVCHDLGKASNTVLVDNAWHAYGHEESSVPLALLMLKRGISSLSEDDYQAISALIGDHMTPYHLIHGNAPLAAYIRLERRLNLSKVTMEHLELMFSCDLSGRGLPIEDKRIGIFRNKMQEIALYHLEELPAPAVQGRHLIARGFKPGPSFKDILAECHRVQIDLEIDNPEEILRLVLTTS